MVLNLLRLAVAVEIILLLVAVKAQGKEKAVRSLRSEWQFLSPAEPASGAGVSGLVPMVACCPLSLRVSRRSSPREDRLSIGWA